MSKLVERFLDYVKVDTKSEFGSSTFPSSLKQFDLAKQLEQELKELGLDDVKLDENCYLTATLKSNMKESTKVVGLIAHMDTSPDYSGKDVNPLIHENFDGNDLKLSENTILSVKDFPKLKNYIGKTLITTDGSTLLGADNKAGIAEIITAVEYLISNPEIKHGDIKILFTPDEEVGQGTDKINLDDFKVDFAYTIDGGELGELEFENFNAASAKIKINGINIHPGNAKDKMVNSIQIGMEFNSLLPNNQRPEHTEVYEGFFHLNDFNGCVENTEFNYIIRDHDFEKFETKKELIKKAADFINVKYGEKTLELSMQDSYYNMRSKIEPVMEIVDLCKDAMIESGVDPLIKPIRGGTDGARLSFMGIPTPNIFTGGHNFHGRFEFIAVESMEKAVEVIVKVVEKVGKLK